jgi:hypothetical protein
MSNSESGTTTTPASGRRLNFIRHSHDVIRGELAKLGPDGVESVEELSDLMRVLASERDIEALDRPCDALSSAIEKLGPIANDFFGSVWPDICRWLLDDAQSGELPLMFLGDDRTVVRVSETTVRYFLAHAFLANLMSFDEHVALVGCDALGVGIEHYFGELSFVGLYTRPHCVESEQRILCLLAYFAGDAAKNADPNVFVEFQRHQVHNAALPSTAEQWLANTTRITRERVAVHGDLMESVMRDARRPAFFDFANRDLQIHKNIPSCTQEEILFSCAPACFLGLLICERMSDAEVITIRNVRRVAKYTGYLSSFRFAGAYEHVDERFDVVAADACVFSHFATAQIVRDLNKGLNAFLQSGGAISSGAWGCGAFGGDFAAKTVQMLAASAVADTFLFLSAMDSRRAEAQQLIDAAVDAELTVGDCARILLEAHHARQQAPQAVGGRPPSFHQYFIHACQRLRDNIKP